MATKDTGITLSAIAAELGMSPKNARARMRRIDIPSKHLVGKGETWTFKASAKGWVVAQLKRDGRKV